MTRLTVREAVAQAYACLNADAKALWEAEKKPRKPSLARTIRTARAAGVDLMMAPDGTMILKCSQPPVSVDLNGSENEWDKVLRREPH